MGPRLAALAALAVVVCSPAYAKPKQSDPDLEFLKDVDVAVKTTIVDLGAAPQLPFRLDVRPGTRQALTMTTSTTGTMTMLGSTVTLPEVPIEVDLDLHVPKVDRRGAQVEATYSAVRVPPAPEDADPLAALTVSATTASFAQLAGTRMSYRLHPNFEVSDMRLVGGGADSVLHDALKTLVEGQKQAQIWLPQQAFGVGATWTAQQTVSFQGTPMVALHTFTVTERTERAVEVDVATEMDLSQLMQALLDSPEAPAGLTTEPMVASGRGHYRLESGTPTPVGETTVRMRMAMSSGAESAMAFQMSMDVVSHTVIAARP